jgi:hypothetical protein
MQPPFSIPCVGRGLGLLMVGTMLWLTPAHAQSTTATVPQPVAAQQPPTVQQPVAPQQPVSTDVPITIPVGVDAVIHESVLSDGTPYAVIVSHAGVATVVSPQTVPLATVAPVQQQPVTTPSK